MSVFNGTDSLAAEKIGGKLSLISFVCAVLISSYCGSSLNCPSLSSKENHFEIAPTYQLKTYNGVI